MQDMSRQKKNMDSFPLWQLLLYYLLQGENAYNMGADSVLTKQPKVVLISRCGVFGVNTDRLTGEFYQTFKK